MVAQMLDTGSSTPVSSNADVTNIEYDIAGNLVSATLSCCNVESLSYSKDHEYAFPVSVTKGSSPTALTTSKTYNRNTGLELSSTTENNQLSTYEYETDTLRMKKINYPNGGYILSEYSDKLVSALRPRTGSLALPLHWIHRKQLRVIPIPMPGACHPNRKFDTERLEHIGCEYKLSRVTENV